jgi:hypothetical protein
VAKSYLLARFDSELHNKRQQTPDTGCPEDTDMPDAEPLSSDPSFSIPTSTTKPNQPRLSITSLCNPMDEVADIRPPQASSLFDMNLDAVYKPSWMKDYRCEQLYLFASPLFLSNITISRN